MYLKLLDTLLLFLISAAKLGNKKIASPFCKNTYQHSFQQVAERIVN